MNKKIWETGVIVADDLTGAMDAGVQCIGTNEVEVIVDSKCFHTELIKKGKFLSVNTQSRQVRPEKAMKIVSKLVESLGTIESPFFLYKKVDSTLRGNLVVEIWKLVQFYRPKIVVFTPAIPSLGRKVIGGKLFVNGKNLTNTPYIKETTGASVENIASMFKESWPGCNVFSVPPLVSFEVLNSLIERKTDVVIADASEEEHLEHLSKVGNRLEKEGHKIMWSGSSGLLKGLQAQHVFNNSKSYDLNKSTKGPFLVVSGSTRKIADKQIAKAVLADPHCLSISCQYISGPVHPSNKCNDTPLFLWKTNKFVELGGSETTDEIKDIIDRARNSLLGGENVYICSVSNDKNRSISDYVSVVFSQVVKRILLAIRVDNPTLILVGGDTANLILTNLGVTKTSLVQDIEPYIPLGIILDGMVSGSFLVTKAGGFGDSDTVKRIVHKLTGIKN